MDTRIIIRDVEELLVERGRNVDHFIGWSWVQRPTLFQKFSAYCDRSSDRPTIAGRRMRFTSGLREAPASIGKRERTGLGE